MESPLSAVFQLLDAFRKIGIDYVIVGSLASSVYGEYRASADIDVLADITDKQIPLLVDLLTDFYVDRDAASRSIASGRSFNIIHVEAVFKIDIFPCRSEFDSQQLARRQSYDLSEDSQQMWIATAEDTVLAKLRWFRLDEEVSELQWRDIRGVLGTQGKRLDMDYMRGWAQKLEVADLFERAIHEAH